MRNLIFIILGVLAGLAARVFIVPMLAKPVGDSPPVAVVEHKTEPTPLARAAPQDLAENPIFKRELFVRGYVARNGRFNVIMSDGTTLTESEVDAVGRNGVIIRGQPYALKRSPVDTPNPAVPSAQPQPRPNVPATSEYSGEAIPWGMVEGVVRNRNQVADNSHANDEKK